MRKADKGAQKNYSDPSQIGPTLTLRFQLTIDWEILFNISPLLSLISKDRKVVNDRIDVSATDNNTCLVCHP
jgi:hypothetical protein